MVSEFKSEIKKAVIYAFVKTEEKYLSYSDFTRILFSQKEKKVRGKADLKKKEAKYERWEKEFKDQLKGKGWKYPFKHFDINKEGYLSQALRELQKGGFLKKEEDKGYSLSSGFIIDYIRKYDIESIEKPHPNEIILPEGIIRFYGFEFLNSQIKIEYRKEFKRIITKFLDVTAELFELNYRLVLESYLNEIFELHAEKTSPKISPLYQLLCDKFEKLLFEDKGKDGLIATEKILDKNKLSENLMDLGNLEDIYYGRYEDKYAGKNYDDNVEWVLDALHISNKNITIHPIDFQSEMKIMEDRKKWDRDEKKQWDVFDQNTYISILQKILSRDRFSYLLKKHFDKNREKWEKIPVFPIPTNLKK